MLADTSSPAAGSTLKVGAAAARCAARRVEPIVARSAAVAATISGTATTYGMTVLPSSSETSATQHPPVRRGRPQ